MAKLILVRQERVELTAHERDVLRLAIFKIIDGLGPQNQKRWRGWWKRILNMEPGECVELSSHQERVGWTHRLHMRFEQQVFEHQEQFQSFPQFRNWLKIGSGLCDWFPGGPAEAPLVPVPKSISYDEMGQDEFEQFHHDATEFLRTDRACVALWPHLPMGERINMIETIIEECKAERI